MDVIEREWHMPSEFPDLRDAKQISIDLETKDPNIKTNGPGWATKDGHIIGIAVATGDMSWYLPIRHERPQHGRQDGDALAAGTGQD
jgi:hypothetical protein